MKKLLLGLLMVVLSIGLTSCKKEDLDLDYEGELFRIEMYTQSWFTSSPRYYKSTDDFNVIGGEVVEIENDYMLVAIKKNHSIQLSTISVLSCSGGQSQAFTATKVDDNGNDIAETRHEPVRCETNTTSFRND